MKRLVERELPPQSIEGEARALLEATSPWSPAPGMKQRVRAGLLTTPLETRGFRPRAALVLALVLLGSVAAAATYFVRRGAPAELVTAPVVPVTATPVPRRVEPRAPEPSSAVPLASSAVEVPKGAPAPGRSATKSNDEASEANLLFEATRALRREGNPARASELLAEHRKKFPRGALAEEALALSIEVAVARGDARASKLAQRYLELYPDGHFVNKAKRALGKRE